MSASGPAPAAIPRGGLATAAGAALALFAVTLTGPIAPMGIGLALLAALTLALLARTPRPAWPKTPVDRAGIAWLVAILVVSAFAQEPARSIGAWKKGVMPAIVALTVFHAADRRVARRALAAWLAASGVVAVISFAIWWSHGHGYAWRSRGLVGHYMTFGGQLGLEFPVALALAFFAKSPRWRAGAAAVAALTALALAITFTRSSWLGALASAVLIVGVAWPLGVGLLAVAAALAWVFAPGEWGDRIRGMFDSQHGYTGQRPLMWKAGLHMFRDHPLTGVGMQDLREIYWRYREPGAYERVGHLHNSYVQIAATMGVTGLAAAGWLFASLLRAASPAVTLGRGFRERLRAGGDGAALRLGVTAALLGFLVAGFAEWNFGDEELLYPLYLLAGLAWASRGWDEPEER